MSAFIEIDGSDVEDSALELSPPNGGSVYLEPGEKYLSTGPMNAAPSSVPFGALSFEVPSHAIVQLDGFEYRYRDDSILQRDGWLSFLNAGIPFAAAGSVSDADDGPEVDMSRRRMLAATGAALGGGLISMSDVAAGKSQTVRIATFSVTESDGFGLRLTDDVASVLPASQEYLVLSDNVEVGTLSTESPETTIGRGTTGEFHVLTETDLSTWQSIKTGLFGESEDDVPQTFEVSLPQSATEYEDETTVNVGSGTAAVQAIDATGPEETMVELGDESLRHESEDGNEEAGYWHVEDGQLLYVAGTDPPDASSLTITADIGPLDELKDDISRLP